MRLQPGLGAAQGSTGVRDPLPCSLPPQGCLLTQQLASTRVSVPREDTQDGSHRPFFFFCLNTWMYFSWITKSPESRTRQIQVSFHLPHNTTDFFFFGSATFSESSLSPGLLLSDCRMTAACPGITPTFKTKRMGKGAPAASPLYQDRKSFPRNPHSIDGLLYCQGG